MGAKGRLVATLLIYSILAPYVSASDCSYFTAIPQEERPDDLEEEDFTGLTWADRPLIPGPLRDDVCMGEYVASSSTVGTQIIYMEEEIEGEVQIAKLNYNGTETPYIGSFYVGTRTYLSPVIEQDTDSYWYLVIQEKQDYETAAMQQYMFEVRVSDMSLVARVSLLIVNIDDNAPIINVFDNCIIPEDTELGLSDCVYQVTDVDGEISTRFMTFEITSTRGDEEVFYIDSAVYPDDEYTMNMTIGLLQTLDYTSASFHLFSVTASDSLPNNHTASIMIEVENVEQRNPTWVEIWAVQQFDEKTYQNFSVMAIDGDTGINKPIFYRLENNESYPFFSIETLNEGRGGGMFYVDPIDRDTLEQQLFTLSIVAYKTTDEGEELSTETSIVIIVDDVNDQYPVPLSDNYTLEIDEETAMTFSFDEEFGFHDRDLGENAQYSVVLESVYPDGAASAFYVSPSVGYQRQTFIMGTLNHTMLDYEVPEFQNITLRMVATDLANSSHVGVATIYINLLNWNDEEPIFTENTYSATFNETEGEGFFVANVTATDRDIDDFVVHSILGNAATYLTIDNSTGAIYVSADDVFDYSSQSELYVNIRAVDTLGDSSYHTTTTQLVIQLIDVNNNPPVLRLPRGSPQVEENVPEGYLITEGITATDVDTSALLVFEIDWTTSYATKSGQDADEVEFYDCVRIETTYPTENNTMSAVGRIVAQEIRDNVTIDYEMFEILYLTIRVVDQNTEIGDDYDELTLTVVIIDMNDNAPIFSAETLNTSFVVREVASSDTVIGTVTATDADGPLYNTIRYSIYPRLDTPSDLVKIDATSGQLEVDQDAAIDADEPPRQYLYYTVVASDQCTEANITDCPDDPTYWETEGNISISITDTNNKYPTADLTKFNTTVYIYENATTGDEVVQIAAIDLDRDEIYHNVSYQINYAVNSRLRYFFNVELETGLVYVDYTTDEVLDRDGTEPEHSIFLYLYDNYYSQGDGNRNQAEVEILVVLLDVNDNAPELPTSDELTWTVSENTTQGVRVLPSVYAYDRDEPETNNSRVGYSILSLTCTNRDIEVPDLFDIVNVELNSMYNVSGELETGMDLAGYWGSYEIVILAYDHGIPQQSSNDTYELVIRPYNFNAPQIVFPENNTVIRLAREKAIVSGILSLTNEEYLDSFNATDDDGLEAGEVTFSITGDVTAQQYLSMSNSGDNTGALVLTQLFSEEIMEFNVVLRATDGGTEPGPLYSEVNLTVAFVPTSGEPTFTTTTAEVAFLEKEDGLEESFQLPLATDSKNYLCSDDCYDIFYYIISGNTNDSFFVNETTNVIQLLSPLNRTESTTHTLEIAATNTAEVPETTTASSILTVTVSVREADPKPEFAYDLYMAGISTSDTIGRELLTVQATHTENLAIAYSMNLTSMEVDDTLEAVKDSAFILNPSSGVLSLNFQPTASMLGMFVFDVIATDTANASSTTEIRVYLITAENRVYFYFYNPIAAVQANTDFIAQTFTSGFGMTCNIDTVVQSTDSDGVALEDITEVRAHFILDDMPVDASVIEALRTDTTLLRSIQNTLSTELLVLTDFVTDLSPDTENDSSLIILYVLVVLSTILAVMVVVLMITYFIKTKALNRRLEALSTTKFGSVDSGLNRIGAIVPGTNKHAAEGSNPIWNEQIKAPDFDAISETSSYDSDLIGVEDLPQFSIFDQEYINNPIMNNDTSQMDLIQNDTVPNHSNNFGYKSPFSRS